MEKLLGLYTTGVITLEQFNLALQAMATATATATPEPQPQPQPVAKPVDTWAKVEEDKKKLAKRKAKLIKGLGEIDSDDDRAIERRSNILAGISNADSLHNKEDGFRLGKEAKEAESKAKEDREDAINTPEQREELGEQVKTCNRITGFVVRDTKGSEKVPAKTTATLTMVL